MLYTDNVPRDRRPSNWWSKLYWPSSNFTGFQFSAGFGVGVGDTIDINILGRELTAKILSLRKIDWRSMRMDFAIIFGLALEVSHFYCFVTGGRTAGVT